MAFLLKTRMYYLISIMVFFLPSKSDSNNDGDREESVPQDVTRAGQARLNCRRNVGLA